MTSALRELIEAEAQRAESDLTTFRARALSLLTTSSSLVTLLTGIITFAAAKAEDERGVPDVVIVFLGVAFAFFLASAILALRTNSSKDVDRPGGASLQVLTEKPSWAGAVADPEEAERKVANVLVKYVVSLRTLADTAATELNWAIRAQIAALAATALAGFLAALTIN